MAYQFLREVKVRFSERYFNRKYGNRIVDTTDRVFSFASEVYDGRNNTYAIMAFDSPLQPLDIIYLKEDDLRYYLENPKDILSTFLENATAYCLVHYLPYSEFDNHQLSDCMYIERLKEIFSGFHFQFLDMMQVDSGRNYRSFREEKIESSEINHTDHVADNLVDYNREAGKIIKSEKKLRAVRSGGLRYIGQIRSVEDAMRLIGKELSVYNREVVYILNLDHDGIPKSYSIISSGGLSSSVVDMRVLYQQALLTGTDKIIVIHNHPSGETEPSEHDIRLIRSLNDNGKMMGVKLVDSIIIGAGFNEDYKIYSMREDFPQFFSNDFSALDVRSAYACEKEADYEEMSL